MGVGWGGGGGGVEAWGGEVDEPEIVKGADMHGEDEVAEEGVEDVGCPDAAESELAFGFWFRGGGGGFGKARFQFVAVGAGRGRWGVNGVRSGEGSVLVSARAEEAGYGVAETHAEVRLVTEGV